MVFRAPNTVRDTAVLRNHGDASGVTLVLERELDRIQGTKFEFLMNLATQLTDDGLRTRAIRGFSGVEHLGDIVVD